MLDFQADVASRVPATSVRKPDAFKRYSVPNKAQCAEQRCCQKKHDLLIYDDLLVPELLLSVFKNMLSMCWLPQAADLTPIAEEAEAWEYKPPPLGHVPPGLMFLDKQVIEQHGTACGLWVGYG